MRAELWRCARSARGNLGRLNGSERQFRSAPARGLSVVALGRGRRQRRCGGEVARLASTLRLLHARQSIMLGCSHEKTEDERLRVLIALAVPRSRPRALPDRAMERESAPAACCLATGPTGARLRSATSWRSNYGPDNANWPAREARLPLTRHQTGRGPVATQTHFLAVFVDSF